jgi:hypothetical protein
MRMLGEGPLIIGLMVSSVLTLCIGRMAGWHRPAIPRRRLRRPAQLAGNHRQLRPQDDREGNFNGVLSCQIFTTEPLTAGTTKRGGLSVSASGLLCFARHIRTSISRGPCSAMASAKALLNCRRWRRRGRKRPCPWRARPSRASDGRFHISRRVGPPATPSNSPRRI